MTEPLLAPRPTTPQWRERLRSVLAATPEVEPWPNHARLRWPELELVAEQVPSGTRTLLEIGCGNAMASVFLAGAVPVVVASDLAHFERRAHAIGMEQPRRLVAAMGAEGVELLACSGEQLPVADGSIDVVLMHFSLEHIPDRDRCVQEVRRVLRPGGTFITCVPATATSVLYPLVFYVELGRRVLRRAGRALRPRAAGGGVGDGGSGEPMPVVTDWPSFRRAYPQFPVPPPHGEFRSYLDELRHQRPADWSALCERAGLTVERVVPMSVLPVTTFIALLGRRGLRLWERLGRLDRRLAAGPAGPWLAHSVCVVATA